MSGQDASPDHLAQKIADAAAALAGSSKRQLVAVAGPPGSGKSTLAELAQHKLEKRGIPCGLVSMDGFHFDNAILSVRGLLDRKGAPETFDIAGFRAILGRLLVEDEVAVPEFDRTLDKAIAARTVVTSDQLIVLVEGNYLLLEEPRWADLQKLWASSVFLDVALPTLEARLTERWVAFGLDPKSAKARALSNDIPNARRVLQNSSEGAILIR